MVNPFLIIINNWKKSLFGFGVLSYGIDYSIDHYRMHKIMRAYCEEAAKYGDEPLKNGKLRRITVILNPAANKRKAKKQFEKYCAPILYLSGLYVSILETEREGHARELIDKIDLATDGIVIAGGDGTLSETLTGLMRSRGELCHIPVGVLPLGKTNTLAGTLYSYKKKDYLEWMAEATMAIVKGNTKPIDAFRIEILKTESNESNEGKPVYGVGKVEWGITRELKRRSESLWFLGPLSRFASLVFTGSGLHTDNAAQHHSRGLITAQLRYTPPCQGCSYCFKQRPDLINISTNKEVNTNSAASVSRWWNIVSLKNRRAAQIQNGGSQTDYNKILNEACSTVEETIIKTSDICLTTINVGQEKEENEIKNTTATSKDAPHILLKIGPEVKSQGQLISQGMKVIKEENSAVVELKAKQIEIRPILNISDEEFFKINEKEIKEDCISIDNEDYEVRPIKVTVLPNSVKVFFS